MSTDIALIIRKLLLSTGEASIPGVGTLVLSTHGAVYDKSKSLLYPPQYRLDFKDSILDESKTIDYISSYYGISNESAQKALDLYSSKLIDRLNSVNLAVLNGVGTLTILDGKVNFNPDSNILSWYTKGLQDIKPKMVDKSFEPIIELKTSIDYKADHTWRWLPFLFLLCIGTMVYKYLSINHAQSSERSDIIEQTKGHLSSGDKPQSLDTSLGSKSGETIAIEKDTCIIITGYFTSARNVLKMTNKIENMGYEVFLEEIADGTRVGIRLDCTKMDLRQKIYDIRDSLTKDAWYLQPPITVE